MKPRTRALLTLHFIVFLWGFTGILGKELHFSVFVLVALRMLIALASIALYAVFTKKSLVLPRRDVFKLIGVGVLTALHWCSFFYSIHQSNVSTTLSVISTTAFFVALISPFFTKSKLKWKELSLGVLVIAGIAIIFSSGFQYATGIIFSLIAALLAAVFSSFNGRFIQRLSATNIAFYEMLGGSIIMVGIITFNREWDVVQAITAFDWMLLLLLGTATTAFAFIASVHVMKHLSPFTCAMAINLEPVYTIVFALLIYGSSEFMSGLFYVGTCIILTAVWLESIKAVKK